MNEVLGVLVGVVVVLFAWLGLVVLPRRAGQLDGLHTFAARSGARVSGDGRHAPFTAVGTLRGRAFSVTWQPGATDLLIVAVDCDAGDQPLEGAEVQDAALVARWTAPTSELLTAESLTRLVEALTTTAEEVEAAGGGAADLE